MLKLVPRAKSSRPPPGSILEPLLSDPHTLATLAAAMRVCDHPDASRVGLDCSVSGQESRVTWCAACGALAHTDRDAPIESGDWHRSTVASLLSPELLGDVRELARRAQRIERSARALFEAALARGEPLGPTTEGLSLLAAAAESLALSPALVGSARLVAAAAAMGPDGAACLSLGW
jgi:hypothetical protein